MKLFTVVFIRLSVNTLAVSDIILKRNHTIWAMANTTKKLNIHNK